MDKILNKLSIDVEKLGAIGTVSYIGALFCLISALFMDFSTGKGWAIIVFGLVLLLLAPFFYLMQLRAENRKEALKVLQQIYQRLAEQTAKGTNEQTVSMTMTIAELPKHMGEMLKKL